jgi:hypothetical protein
VGRIQELHAYATEDGGTIAGVRTAVDLVAVPVVDVEPAHDLGPRERAELDYLDSLFPHLLFPHLAQAASSRDQRLIVQAQRRPRDGTGDGGWWWW